MGTIRKPRFSDGDVEKAMDGFFNKLLGEQLPEDLHEVLHVLGCRHTDT